jgi:hypothetical protein
LRIRLGRGTRVATVFSAAPLCAEQKQNGQAGAIDQPWRRGLVSTTRGMNSASSPESSPRGSKIRFGRAKPGAAEPKTLTLTRHRVGQAWQQVAAGLLPGCCGAGAPLILLHPSGCPKGETRCPAKRPVSAAASSLKPVLRWTGITEHRPGLGVVRSLAAGSCVSSFGRDSAFASAMREEREILAVIENWGRDESIEGAP